MKNNHVSFFGKFAVEISPTMLEASVVFLQDDWSVEWQSSSRSGSS